MIKLFCQIKGGSMARKGGNPDLQKWQYQQLGDEPLEAQIVVRLTVKQKQKVAKIRGFSTKLRDWIDSLQE